MFRTACVFSMIAATAGQDFSPLDIEEQPDHVVQEWCSTAKDCLADRPDEAPEGVACNSGTCTCSDPYELFENSICKGIDQPDPTVQVIVELTWDDLKCDELPANFRETLLADLEKIYGTSQVDLRLKCGSVVASAVMQAVQVAVAANTNIATAIQNADIVNIAGQVSKADTYAGSGTCALGAGQLATVSIGGVCQPILCASGYTLVSSDNVNEQDVCQVVVAPRSTNDDDLSAGAIGALVVGVVGIVVILVVLVYVCCCRAKEQETQEDLEQEKDLEQENGPDM